jgi:hypothetical protein
MENLDGNLKTSLTKRETLRGPLTLSGAAATVSHDLALIAGCRSPLRALPTGRFRIACRARTARRPGSDCPDA